MSTEILSKIHPFLILQPLNTLINTDWKLHLIQNTQNIQAALNLQTMRHPRKRPIELTQSEKNMISQTLIFNNMNGKVHRGKKLK